MAIALPFRLVYFLQLKIRTDRQADEQTRKGFMFDGVLNVT